MIARDPLEDALESGRPLRRIRFRDGELYVACEEVIDFLFLYVAGELDAERQHEFERHLEKCRSCSAYLESYRRTIALSKQVADAEAEVTRMPEELLEAVLAAKG